MLTNLRNGGVTVQRGIAMTVQSESAALPPFWRPEVRRDCAFILAVNILAEGTCLSVAIGGAA